MGKTLLEALGEKNQQEVDSIVRVLVKGVAKDYAEYKELCGKIRGLMIAQDHIEDLLRANREDGDNE